MDVLVTSWKGGSTLVLLFTRHATSINPPRRARASVPAGAVPTDCFGEISGVVTGGTRFCVAPGTEWRKPAAVAASSCAMIRNMIGRTGMPPSVSRMLQDTLGVRLIFSSVDMDIEWRVACRPAKACPTMQDARRRVQRCDARQRFSQLPDDKLTAASLIVEGWSSCEHVASWNKWCPTSGTFGRAFLRLSTIIEVESTLHVCVVRVTRNYYGGR